MGDRAQEIAANVVIYARQSVGKAKSIADQIAECTTDAADQGWTVALVEQDGISASRFAGKAREAWPRVLEGVEAGEMDVLVLWESSRGDRDAEQWLGLLRRCRDHGVRIRVTSHERTYNLAIPADWKQLATEGVDGHYESEKLSQRVRRGVREAAKAGRPAMGPCPYGYVRTYSPTTGELVGQEPDPATAAVVMEIFDKVARSVALSEIIKDLNARGIAPPAGREWYRMRIRKIATNPAYIAMRRHKDQVHPASWEPLVDQATFYAAGRVLDDPLRAAKHGRPVGISRPGRQVHLLTYLAVCDTCESGIHARATYYACPKGCVNARRTAVDEFVTEAVVIALSNPELYSSLRQAGVDADKEALAAEGEAARLREELTKWRLSAARGKTTEDSLAIIEADLTVQIAAADQRAERAGIPPALRQVLEPGADVRERWAAASLPAKREIIRALAEIRVTPARQNSHVPIQMRLASSRWIGDVRTWGEIAEGS